MKRTFGVFEAVFDIVYLLCVLVMSILLFSLKELTPVLILAGIMSLVLVLGDSFHLIPRIMTIFKRNSVNSEQLLGIGKLVSSITMTIFYILLWHVGLIIFEFDNYILWTIIFYLLGASRIVLSLLPYNKWKEKEPPYMWGIYRNIPFVIMGIMIVILFFINRLAFEPLHYAWLTVLLSFIFYLPVVLFSNKNKKVGMLMLPKSAMYVWLILMFVLI